MKNKILTLSVAAMVVSLTGCGSVSDEENMAGLNKKISEIRLKPGGEIEALPIFAKAEPFSYTSGNLRSIFEKPYRAIEDSQNINAKVFSNNIKPDDYRVKEPLELFDIESLAFIGTMYYDDGEIKAVIQDSSRHSHMITVGNYLGKNHGKITEITDDSIKIVEIMPNGLGWIENPRILRTK